MRSHVGWIRAASVLFLTLALALPAAPVLTADTTVDTVVKLQTPKKDKGRTDGALDEVPVSLWIPDGVPVVRGAVMNPFYLKAVTQSHWQEACRLWGFALIGANYFAVKNQEFATTLQAALKECAAKTGRKELEHVPLCFVGMSAGAGMSMHFARAMPDRTIAVGPVCLEVGPDTPETRGIPVVTVFGDKDMQQMPQLAAKLPVQRKEGARWAIAVQWGRGHEFAAANNIVIPLFDHAIRRRYPAGVTPAAGPVKLVDIPENEGWLGDRGTWETNFAAIASFAAFQGDKGQACWLPDEYLACVWRAFVSRKPVVTITRPGGLGDAVPFSPVAADTPLDAAVEVAGEAREVELFDGNVPLGRAAARPYEFKGVKLAPGVHALIAVATLTSGEKSTSRPATVIAAAKR